MSLPPSNPPGARRIVITLLGKRLEHSVCEELLIDNMGAVRYRDAYGLSLGEGEAWVFDYGAVVGWNLAEADRQRLCHALTGQIEEASSQPLLEDYGYRIDTDSVFNIQHDFLTLPNDEQLTRLALSHAFAQSVKLIFFENQAQEVIQDNAHIVEQLSITGKVPLTRKGLAKLRGKLFSTSSDITLNFNLLDTPEFFWDYPELESYYQSLVKYLDLRPRMDIINKKLATIHDLLDMMAQEQYHKHSAFLEWVIIILIAADIVVYFF